MVRKNESSVAVVDELGEFVGFRSLRIGSCHALLVEHDEDVARLGGYLSYATRTPSCGRSRGSPPLASAPVAGDRTAAPWRSAALVAAFETRLEANVLLAIFVPSVVYVADAVGTQTEALVIRGLSVGVSMREVVRRGVRHGDGDRRRRRPSLLSLRLARLGRREGHARRLRSVARQLRHRHARCHVAALAACFAARLDPLPLAPDPLATVFQDLLSIAVYFAVVVLIVDP